ncbi:MAG: UbiH/UbiF family hydroxylase [Burkholderiales bacterium]
MFDLIIIGAGLVGASLAMALRNSGLKLALVENQAPAKAQQNGWDNRVYAISPGAAAFLQDCGAWPQLDAARITPITEMQIYGDDGVSHLGFSAYDCGLSELALIVENRMLQQALWQQLNAQENLQLYCPAQCAAVEWTAQQVELRLKDGTTLRGRLMVGADGGDSWVRGQAGIAVKRHPYRQFAVVANFATTEPHRGRAFQWFGATDVLAYLPLPEKRISIVWSAPEDFAKNLLALTPEKFCAEVEKTGQHALGALRLITQPAAFALKLLRVERMAAARLALIGDAAHVVHPLAGQGVNLGFQDARVLAETLLKRGVQNDCGDERLLRRYERARQEDTLAMQFATHGLQQLFTPPWFSGLRNFGLRLTNRLPPIKNLLVQRALH